MTITTFSSPLPLVSLAAAQPVLTTTTTPMSAFAAIPILGYSVLALIFSYIVQRLIRLINFPSLLARSSSPTSDLPTSTVPASPKKSLVPSWDLSLFKRGTANAYRKASSLVLPAQASVELLPTHVASPPPTAALVDYGLLYTDKSTPPAGQTVFQPPLPTPPLTSSSTASSFSGTPRTPSPAHHNPFSIPLRIPLPTPFSLFPSPHVPLQPQKVDLQPQKVDLQPQSQTIALQTHSSRTIERPRTPSPTSHPLATTPPPSSAHRRSKSLGGVPVKRVASSRLGHAFPHAEVEMRDLRTKGKDKNLLIDFSSSEEEEDNDLGVYVGGGGRGDMVPGGPLVDLSDRREEEDVFGFKKGVLRGDVELVPLKRAAVPIAEKLLDVPPLQRTTLIDIDVNTSIPEERLVDVGTVSLSTLTPTSISPMDASSSRTISPMEPVVLSRVGSAVPFAAASPVPVAFEQLPVAPVVQMPVVSDVQLPVVQTVPVPVVQELVIPVMAAALEAVSSESRGSESSGEEMVHVRHEDGQEEKEEDDEEEEEEGVLVDVEVSPVDVDVEVSPVDVDVEVSPRPVDEEDAAPEVVEVSRPELEEVSGPELEEVSRPELEEISRPEVVDIPRPKVVEVPRPEVVDHPLRSPNVELLVDVDPSPIDNLPAPSQETTTTSKPAPWHWDEEDDMMRAWSLGLDLVEAGGVADVPANPASPMHDVEVPAAQGPTPSSSFEYPPLHDLLIQQDPQPTAFDSPPLPLLPPLTIPLITISESKHEQEEGEEYPDPELLPLPDFQEKPLLDFQEKETLPAVQEKEKEALKEININRSPPSQTPTPPDSPPSSPGGLLKPRTVPSSPRANGSSPSPTSLTSPSPTSLTSRPAWSIRAADAPPLGLSASASTTPLASPIAKKSGLTLKLEEAPVVQEPSLSSALPGSFPDAKALSTVLSDTSSTTPAPSDTPAPSTAPSTTTTTATTDTATTTATTLKTLSALVSQQSQSHPRMSSPLDIALAMQLRPGLGVGADPAWMVRFLMSMFGWFAILVSGQGEF